MTPERLITAATVTSGEKTDGDELEALIGKSLKTGIEIEDVIAGISMRQDRCHTLRKERQTGYSIKHKMLTLHKVLPPENRPVNEVSRETGISVQTIYKWMEVL